MKLLLPTILILSTSLILSCSGPNVEEELDANTVDEEATTENTANTNSNDAGIAALADELSDSEGTEDALTTEDKEARRQKILDRFDADGDGVLSASEEQNARKARNKMRMKSHGSEELRAFLLENYDTDDDQSLSALELAAAKVEISLNPDLISDIVGLDEAKIKERTAKFIEKFDTNDDGSIDEDEKNSIIEKLAENY